MAEPQTAHANFERADILDKHVIVELRVLNSHDIEQQSIQLLGACFFCTARVRVFNTGQHDRLCFDAPQL